MRRLLSAQPSPVSAAWRAHNSLPPGMISSPQKSAEAHRSTCAIDYTHGKAARRAMSCAHLVLRSVSPARSRLRTIDRIEACAKP